MSSPPSRRRSALRLAILGLGLALGGVMAARSQIGGDQLNLLARGWLLAARGVWIHYGNPLSSGGDAPGSATTVLIAAPLAVWRDARAPVVLILLFHLAACLLLERVVREALGERARIPFLLLYWLSPWQLLFAGFLWNPNFLFLAGAIHLATLWRLREAPRFGATFFHVATLGVFAQVHPSMLLLIVASGLLWVRGLWRPSWPGAFAGAGASLLALVPWALTATRHPGIAQPTHGFLFRGLVTVFPVAKGLLYWIRYGSLAVSEKIARLDFAPLGLDRGTTRALAALASLLAVAAVASFLLPLAANVRLWRHGLRPALRRPSAPLPGRLWLRRTLALSFVAAAIVFAMSPTTIQMWQVVPLFHAAVLVVVLWLDALRRSRRRAVATAALAAWTACAVASDALLAVAAPFQRPGGLDGVQIALRADSPMLRELAIVPRCPVAVNVDGGWWPDVLPAVGPGPAPPPRRPHGPPR